MDLSTQWIWNTSARDNAASMKVLRAEIDRRYKFKHRPYADLEALWNAYSLCRDDLKKCQERVAKDCAPWFDGSAFIAVAAREALEVA